MRLSMRAEIRDNGGRAALAMPCPAIGAWEYNPRVSGPSISGETMRRYLFALASIAALCSARPAFSDPLEQHGQILIVTPGSAMILQVDPGFRPLRPLQFPIEKLTNADRRIFVDADPQFTVHRLVIVQYETVIPGANFKFVFPAKPPAEFGERTYRFGAHVYDDEQAAAKFPDKEAGLTRAFLLDHGFKLPRLLRMARLARVADADGASEIIIFYLENADADYPAGPLAGVDEDGDLGLDEGARRAMLDRLKSAIHLIVG